MHSLIFHDSDVMIIDKIFTVDLVGTTDILACIKMLEW
jgi:hypothetical protein